MQKNMNKQMIMQNF